MFLKSYAKINLTLKVIKKHKNGLHDIQSIFCLVNCFDKILITKIEKFKKDKVIFKGPYSKNVKKTNNSVSKALTLLRKYKYVDKYYKIEITKNLPVFAGLGGGTSNAATIFNFFIKKRIEKKFLNKITRYIGTDLSFFFINQGYLANLKTIIKFKKKYNFYFLVVFPLIKSPTKSVFSKIKKYSKRRIFVPKKIKSKSELVNYLINSKNDLQSIVEKSHPKIRQLLLDISKIKGCLFSRMTGSGSSCFGLFLNEKSSKVALRKIRKKYPKFWFSIAKTI